MTNWMVLVKVNGYIISKEIFTNFAEAIAFANNVENARDIQIFKQVEGNVWKRVQQFKFEEWG